MSEEYNRKQMIAFLSYGQVQMTKELANALADDLRALSDAESRLINLTEALLERAEKVGAVYLWHIKSLIAEALAPASTHPCLVDDTKKGSGQKDQHWIRTKG